MRIGLIARADYTGLGIQSLEFYNHIPCKVLIIDMSKVGKINASPVLIPRPELFKEPTIVSMSKGYQITGGIPPHVIDEFIKDIDLLFCMETPYDYNIISKCRAKGVKTIIQLNYEFLDYPNSHIPLPDLLASPSQWHYNEIPGPKKYLPVPVNTKNFTPQRKQNTFVHIVGRQAVYDRNGTDIFIDSLRHITQPINVTICSQGPIRLRHTNRNINLTTQFKNKQNYYDNYSGGVLVMPRKFGGLCLPINEALAAEMPVIAPDISPNNTWLPYEWLIPAVKKDTFKCRKIIDVYETNVIALSRKIHEFCDPNFYNSAAEKSISIKNSISWDTLLPLYHKTFNDLVN